MATAGRSGNSAAVSSTVRASSASRTSLGRSAEEAACRFLQSAGFSIVSRNYRTRFSEIDIVAFDRGCICFIEVRSKKDSSFGTAAESIDRQKRVRISRAALQYLKENGLLERKARFDVVCVEPDGVRLIRDAFELEGGF